MCIAASGIGNLTNWNWDGDHIVHQAIVPSSRPPVGHTRGNYDIDPREFLMTERNEVIRRTIQRDIPAHMKTMTGANLTLFRSREVGSFDHRADVIASFVSENVTYKLKAGSGNDPWQFPDETLSLKSGDCEDRAFLIASLLLASGVSSFNVRVALGKCSVRQNQQITNHPHAWVMYKTENGYWQVIEPALAKRHSGKFAKASSADDVTYIPQYLLNDSHLWQVVSSPDTPMETNLALQKNWSSLSPKFIGNVHFSIIHEALDSVAPGWVVNAINSRFTSIPFIGRVDDIDKSLSTYDPRDHFDNGYITEGWQFVQSRLAQFKANNVANFDAFYRATHGIADFYAHTSYAHPGFGKRDTTDELMLFNPQNVASCLDPTDYTATTGFDLTGGQFSVNSNLWTGSGAARSAAWKGKLISGRYAQRHDSQGAIEAITFIHPSTLESAPDFKLKGSLPHHNEIAVDDQSQASSHKLYTASAYGNQFKTRYATAVRHIRQAFEENWTH